MTQRLVYKICDRQEWDAAKRDGVYKGAPIDLADGFIHFSAADQVRETAAKHFSGVEDLVIFSVDADALGEAMTWEPSRGGALFPHLYGDLPTDKAIDEAPLPLDGAGGHIFPDFIP